MVGLEKTSLDSKLFSVKYQISNLPIRRTYISIIYIYAIVLFSACFLLLKVDLSVYDKESQFLSFYLVCVIKFSISSTSI